MTDVYPAFVTIITLQDEINVYNILFLFFSVFFFKYDLTRFARQRRKEIGEE